MTHWIEMMRLGAFALMAVGAWQHNIWLLALGLLVILLGWSRGILMPDQMKAKIP